MAVTASQLLRVGHLAASGLVLGALATLPLLRFRLEGHEDSRVTLLGLGYLESIQQVLLIPGAVAILVLGGLMVEGPWATFDFTDPKAGWLHVGATLWLILAGAIGGMWAARSKLEEEAREGTTGGSRVRTYWRAWTGCCLVGVAVVLGGMATMALRLGS